MAWIELHQTLREHKKMFACADDLGFSRIEMIGTLVSLWLWALDNAQDGSLEGVSIRTIARVCDFPEKKATKLMDALQQNGFLDLDEDGGFFKIHDWYDYAGKLMERREKDRKRKKTSIPKPAEFHGNSDGNPEDIHGKSYATVPNRTLPYPTVPNLCGDGGDHARARAATDDELLSIGLDPGETIGVTVDQVNFTRSTAKALFDKYMPKSCSPQPWDMRQVFMYGGTPERAELLDYAFMKAAVAGRPGSWPYISGIMERLSMRGIETKQQAREWDAERPDLEFKE